MAICRHIIPVLAAVMTLLSGLTWLDASAAPKKQFTVVIDAGHGGHDPGALGPTAREKDINLAVALKLGEQLKKTFDDVKVVYTRSTDTFVELRNRVKKATDAKADLMISLHCDSGHENNKNRANLTGTSVYVLGQDAADANIDIAIRENQAILLEADHSTRYHGFDNSPEYYIFSEISQTKMQGRSYEVAAAIHSRLLSHAGLDNNHVHETSKLFILKHAVVPTILVEMDYICNPRRERFLKSSEGQLKIAQAICKGLADYRKTSGMTVHDDKPEPERKSETASDDNAGDDAIIYKIQFLTYTKKLPDGSTSFRGLAPTEYYRDGRSYKYTYGRFTSLSEANAELRKVKKKFPDAFVIQTRGGRRIK